MFKRERERERERERKREGEFRDSLVPIRLDDCISPDINSLFFCLSLFSFFCLIV